MIVGRDAASGMTVASPLSMQAGHDIPERLQFGAGMAIMGSVFVVVQVLFLLERIGDAVVHSTLSLAACARGEASSA